MHNALGVVMHQRTTFEGRAIVFQQTTFGDSTRPGEEHLAPTIGDRVVIGANCVILGGVRVGAGAFVGAGTVVTKDVPPGHIAYGSPMATRPLRDDILINQWF